MSGRGACGRVLAIVVVIAASRGSDVGAREDDESRPDSATGQTEVPSPPVRVSTRSGDLLPGELELSSVRITTDYGVLDVPVADLLRVDFGFRPSDRTRARLLQLVREAARKLVVDQGARDEILSRLSRAGEVALEVIAVERRGVDEEAQKRLDALAEELRAGVGRARRDPEIDTVVARHFTIRGRVELESLVVANRHGRLIVPRAELESLVWKGGSEREATDRVLVVKSWTDTTGEYVIVHEVLDKRTRLRLVEFSGSTSAALRKALRRHRVLVIPELEKAGNSAEVAREASKALKGFVRSGGVVVSCGGSGNIRFLTESGILKCTGGSNDAAANVKRGHPIVRGVGSSLPKVNATFPIRVEGKIKVLASTGNGVVVGVARLGAGAVVYCGWDFFQSEDAHEKVLANAVRWAAAGSASRVR